MDFICREMDEIYNEGAKRGRNEGIAEGIEFGEMKKAKETALTFAVLKGKEGGESEEETSYWD